MEGTNILQEEEVCEGEIELDMFQPELGEELDLPTSPPTYDSNTQTQNSFVAMIIFQLKSIHFL
jgi:hypothetical protein